LSRTAADTIGLDLIYTKSLLKKRLDFV